MNSRDDQRSGSSSAVNPSPARINEPIDAVEICKRLNTTPKRLEEQLLKTMKDQNYGPDTEISRLITTLQALRNRRVSIPKMMRSLK